VRAPLCSPVLVGLVCGLWLVFVLGPPGRYGGLVGVGSPFAVWLSVCGLWLVFVGSLVLFVFVWFGGRG